MVAYRSSATFKGIFDGGYHVVSGLYIDSGSSIGLFGDVNGGEIRNLVVRGEVSGSSNAAGIVGKLTAGKVTNCGNEADVSGGTNVGGVVGSVNGACTVSGCYNSGAVSEQIYRRVTGQHRAGVVEDCYNAGTVSGPATVGGVVGGHKAASPVLSRCYNAGTVVDTAGNSNNIDAVIGASRGTNTDCYFISGSGSSTKSGVTEVSSLTAAELGDAFKADTDGLNGGLPVLTWQERKPDLIIGSYEAFKAFADSVNDGNSYEGKLVRLACNVFLGGKSAPWSPIGSSSASFKGVFDGGYHVVSGLYISSGSGIGLFGDVNGGEIRNLVVRGEVSGSANAAGIVGKLTAGKVTNCGNGADVSGGSCVGGVVVGGLHSDVTAALSAVLPAISYRSALESGRCRGLLNAAPSADPRPSAVSSADTRRLLPCSLAVSARALSSTRRATATILMQLSARAAARISTATISAASAQAARAALRRYLPLQRQISAVPSPTVRAVSALHGRAASAPRHPRAPHLSKAPSFRRSLRATSERRLQALSSTRE
ncbi:MAG: hypothetical protein ACLTTQ_04000 [Christensenellales bacterium]